MMATCSQCLKGHTECGVCGGSGTYPIFDSHGRELYSIACPECMGTGVSLDCIDTPSSYEFPPSTAATITSIDGLREWQNKQR